MSDKISRQSLYNLVNKAIITHSKHDGSVLSDLNKYERMYDVLKADTKQLDIFENDIPTSIEVRDAIKFCHNIEEYGASIDECNDEYKELSVNTYTDIYNYMCEYKDRIKPDVLPSARVVAKIMRRHMPRFKDEEHLSYYNNYASRIYNSKIESSKKKKQGLYGDDWHEKHAVVYFEEFLADEKLDNIPASPLKLQLYENSILIVDCLPNKYPKKFAKYKLTSRYKHKISLCDKICDIARKLGEDYKGVVIKYYKDSLRYNDLRLNAQSHSRNKRKLTPEEIAKKQHDEWLCK